MFPDSTGCKKINNKSVDIVFLQPIYDVNAFDAIEDENLKNEWFISEFWFYGFDEELQGFQAFYLILNSRLELNQIE